MLPRANWNGYLKLSLVSCPIALFPASSSSERVAFRQINKKTGHRLKQQLIDSVTGEIVEAEDRGRGYEIGKEEYLPIEDAELDAIEVESTHTIEIQSFVPKAQIDKRYYDTPYYIVPDGAVGIEAFAVIRDAMRAQDRVALGRVVISRREHVIAIEPFDRGLLGMTLRYPYEVRAAGAYFDTIPEVKVPAEMRELAVHILESKAGDFEPERFEDRYQNALLELIRAKRAGLPKAKAKPLPAPARVVNIMDALRRSLEQERRKPMLPTRAPAPPARARARIAGQTELLLPIPGKKAAEAEARPTAAAKSHRKKTG